MFYVDIIKDEPKQGHKWRVVLKRCSTGNIVMAGKYLYRYKRDAKSIKRCLETDND